MSKTTAARTALRTAVASALIVLVTGVGAGASWADEPVGTTTTASYENGTDGATGTGTTGGTTGTAAATDNNPWD
ncbi:MULTISPECIES: hypothetical protein [unclassified Streptomyces]|uniref:hypothetical protein n=1 Tax=unclassified Streptomyces TaxID=2593676 RepID=UPI0006C6F14E|nr:MULTISPECIES: hypothetical protein [unclassified Streptomyces]KOX19232.1 hypothetical protein ADL06_29920 [Streptomyces sp. NRRL F-6491]KOX37088.1 hypothetical protein ADL08_30580 [Streptomyces sp. NRRL F-6492]